MNPIFSNIDTSVFEVMSRLAREGSRRNFQRSRDRFSEGLRHIGFPVLPSQASYFVSIDLAPLGLNVDDETFCKRLVAEHGVASIPISAFYAEEPVRATFVFCFAKTDATLDRAPERLAGAARRIASSASSGVVVRPDRVARRRRADDPHVAP
jgi:aspartate/methionine/tyrosine aminotransferase